MCFYTGRYNITHGATYNNIPLRVDELTIGDDLRPLGYRVAVVGKTHFKPDSDTMHRLGIDAGAPSSLAHLHAGFEPFENDDGLHVEMDGKLVGPDPAYNAWLRQLGYSGTSPWQEWANSVINEDGAVLSGWSMRNAGRPARVREEHSETAYMTHRALEFLSQADGPWCLHLSYIKPHWPYVAPSPYHAIYGPADLLAANRSDAERCDPHPVVAAFMAHEESINWSRDNVRETVIPTYMGLVSQFDHHVGRVIDQLAASGLAENTIILVTSDHGDLLGDHWLGEKDLFYEEIVRKPLIVADPRACADPTRRKVRDELVESIDLVPTF
jgi:arylsulfatase A-like enzyme